MPLLCAWIEDALTPKAVVMALCDTQALLMMRPVTLMRGNFRQHRASFLQDIKLLTAMHIPHVQDLRTFLITTQQHTLTACTPAACQENSEAPTGS